MKRIRNEDCTFIVGHTYIYGSYHVSLRHCAYTFMHQTFFPDAHVVINLSIIHDKRHIVKLTLNDFFVWPSCLVRDVISRFIFVVQHILTVG